MTLALPAGWDDRAVRATETLAAYFKADPRGVLAIWNSESGLYPHLAGPAGYFGLIMARPQYIDGVIGTSWQNLVTNGTVVDQIAAIKVFWDKTARTVLGGDTVQGRARKLGVRGDTVLYCLNFVPAYFAHMTSKTQPMVVSAQKGGGNDGGVFYRDNPGFDLDGKGYITVLDVQKRIDRMMQAGMAAARTAPLFSSVKKKTSLRTIAEIAIGGAVAALLYSWLRD